MAVKIDELATLDATAQAELVRRRDLTPLELVDSAIERIERLNPKVNAVITPLFEEARAAATSPDLPEGPFRGVPFLLKDLLVMQKGQPYYMGNRALRDAHYISPADSPLGARFRAAGLITLGKSNAPEFGIQTTTQPLAFGATHNPWDLDRSTNGSSGGSAAAVAAGMVPIAHANDGGGSIRLPAAWCGLVGLKPSRGRVSLPFTFRAIAELVVSRTVRDAAGILDAVHGSEPGDLFLLPPPIRTYAAEIGVDPGKLRIGILTRTNFGEVHAECLAATIATARLLESLGHTIEESSPEAMFDPDQQRYGLQLLSAGTRAQLHGLSQMLGRAATQEDVEPYFWFYAQLPQVAAEDYVSAIEWQHQWAMRVARWWATGFDLLLTPTVWEPAATLADMTPVKDEPWKLGIKVGQHASSRSRSTSRASPQSHCHCTGPLRGCP
jgi:amidase